MPLPKPTKEMLNPLYWWREFVRKLQELRGRPRDLSLGLAIGVFVGITPTIPLHTVLAVALAAALRGSKLAAALGVWVANPLTIPLFYYGSYRLGSFVLGMDELTLPSTYSVFSLMKLSGNVTVAMLHGGVLLGIVPAVLTYFLTYRFTSSPRFQKEPSSPAENTSDPGE